jgi:hypothetical protein
VFTKVAVRDYRPILCKEAILLASAILKNPDSLEKQFQRSTASAAMSILYDNPTLENEHDKALTDLYTFIDRVSIACSVGPQLVELFPWVVRLGER